MELLRFATPEDVALAATERFIARTEQAVNARGNCSVFLAGGSTPRTLYSFLSAAEFISRIEWPSVHVFFGDERCVPPGHQDSNYRMACRTLLTRLRLPSENIHRIRGELGRNQAAEVYETELRAHFAHHKQGTLADLILLGMGGDGHIASLFPGSPALSEGERWVAPVAHRAAPDPPIDRVSLTPVFINLAEEVIFLVTGAGKAERLRQAMQGSGHAASLPAQLVRPASGNLTWLVDEVAARWIV